MYKFLDDNAVKKINLIDEFRGRFSVENNEKLSLPQIIVVGDQSSGKSSILQAISGINLPRGVGTVTICPAIIQMRTSEIERKLIKYKDVEFKEIEDTKSEIERIQKEVFNSELTKEPITLLIESPRVQTLTIIDLPGFVNTKTEGQSKDIVEKTHTIAKSFMKQENSLIICVMPANQDISTTTTINLAKECNKDMSRIIGVLTKLDKLDDKEAGLLPDILKNKKLKISKGYYGLVVGDPILSEDFENRSKIEKLQFEKINLHGKEYSSRLGLQNFTDALVRELVCLIDKSLPELQNNMQKLIVDTNHQLSKFAKYHNNTQLQTEYLIEVVKEVNQKVERIFTKADYEIVKYKPIKDYLNEKNFLTNIKDHDTFLYFWHNIFKELYDKYNETFKDFFILSKAHYKNPEALEEIIKRSRTENLSIFSSSKPFKTIVEEILKQFKDHSIECMEKCNTIIRHVIPNVLTDHIEGKLGQLKNDIETDMYKILEDNLKQLKVQINFLFESELSFFSQDAIVEEFEDKETVKETPENNVIQQAATNGSNYLTASPLVPTKLPISLPTTANVKDILPLNNKNKYKNGKKLKEDLEKYVKNLIRRLGDTVPNFIRLSLFTKFGKDLSSRLPIAYYHTENLKKYFVLRPDESERYDTLTAMKNSLDNSYKQLLDLRNGFKH